jgi:hypothetical protein
LFSDNESSLRDYLKEDEDRDSHSILRDQLQQKQDSSGFLSQYLTSMKEESSIAEPCNEVTFAWQALSAENKPKKTRNQEESKTK